jgi:hypothetical protein
MSLIFLRVGSSTLLADFDIAFVSYSVRFFIINSTKINHSSLKRVAFSQCVHFFLNKILICSYITKILMKIGGLACKNITVHYLDQIRNYI